MIDSTVFLDKTAAYYTLGCKLNFAETSTIGRSLLQQGIRTARPGEQAQICVINTCSVTEQAAEPIGSTPEPSSSSLDAMHNLTPRRSPP